MGNILSAGDEEEAEFWCHGNRVLNRAINIALNQHRALAEDRFCNPGRCRMKETLHFCLKQRTEETQQSQDRVRNSLGQHVGVLLLSVFTLPSSGAAAGCGRQASLVPTNTTQEVAAVGELPWMVSLQEQGGHVALGSILSQDWILSTASSFHSRAQLSVLAGASDPKGPGESLVPIQTIVPHEAFDEITLVHNIALLKTSTPLRFSVTVQPVCFPTPDFPGATLKKCFVAGWLDPRGGVGPLQKLPVEDVEPCPLHRTVSTECCSHREGDQMPGCLGSAGNPVLCEAEGRQVLKGLLSEGGTRCYGPFLYSRLIYYSDWIVATTAKWRAPASPFPGQRYQAFGGPAEEREGLLFEPFLDLRALKASDASEDPLSPDLSEELEESGLGPPKGPVEARVKLPLYYDYYGGELLAMSSAKPGHPWRLQGLLCMGLLLHLLAS